MSVVVTGFLLTLIGEFFGYITSEPQHGYMTHYYFNRHPIQVNDSMVLELTNRLLPDMPDDRFLSCDVTIMTSPGHRLLLHFMSLKISDEDKTLDRLHIFDYSNKGEKVRVSPVQGLYGLYDMYYQGRARAIRDYISTGDKMTLNYQGKPTLAFDGFKILITAFRDVKGDCGRGYARCSQKQICIPVSTWCDSYQNCGAGDSTDEHSCQRQLGNTWKPIDGQVAAVIAASSSCLAFLLAIGVVMVVIVRLNKRDIINNTTNISVGFRKRKSRRKSDGENREQLTKLYGPPSYELAVEMDEKPPPYHAVADESDTETSDVDGSFCHVTTVFSHEGVSVSANDNAVNDMIQSSSKRKKTVTSALVECDIDIETNPNQARTERKSDFQELTNLRLCAPAAQSTFSNINNKRKAVIRGSDLDEIEVLESQDIHTEICETSFTYAKTNGHCKDSSSRKKNGRIGKHNGHRSSGKNNGHSIKYSRHTSGRESPFIDNVDSE